ncbi:MAG: precorrin-6y C5,15-methyltransferase (decarboxylating) subunit CbiE [Candidatus Bathyarchaeota archaeon]|nr:precorrin-6y C5,15-methyltransferase (decarboxylating) subunit CbiE [Candidatus Bathyarchaeota archaeon]
MAKLHIVGVGPGSPEYVSPAAHKAVQKAQLVVGAERNLKLFRGEIKGESLTLTAKNVEEGLKYAVGTVKKGKNVALLSTGDPGFSGLLGSMLRRQLTKDVEVNVIPGVSSIQACAAKLCMSWDNAVLFTFHNDPRVEKKRDLAKAVKEGKTVLALPDPNTFTPDEIAAFLLKEGADKKTNVVVCINLTLPNEKIIEASLEEVSEQKFHPLCVMVIKSN